MENFNLIQFLVAHKLQIFSVITSVIGTASIIVKLTPSTKDDQILAKIKAFVGKFIALN